MLRSSYDACACSTQTTSIINLKRSTLHLHEGQADRPNTPSDSVNPGSNPGPSAWPTTKEPTSDLVDLTPEQARQSSQTMLPRTQLVLRTFIESGDTDIVAVAL